MKVLIFCFVITAALFARVNPFEPTDTFEEKRLELIKQYDELKPEVTVISKQKDLNTTESNKTKELSLPMEADLKPIKETVENKTKPKKVKVIKSNCKESYVYTPFPFIKIYISIDSFKVEVDKKYKLINQDVRDKEKKFVFDFEGGRSFYTKRQKLCHSYFDSFTIGSHPKKNFFRVVIKVKEDMANYKDKSDLKKGTVNYK